MTSLRHYHLGCGESLHSNLDSLRDRTKQQQPVQSGKFRKQTIHARQGKKH